MIATSEICVAVLCCLFSKMLNDLDGSLASHVCLPVWLIKTVLSRTFNSHIFVAAQGVNSLNEPQTSQELPDLVK